MLRVHVNYVRDVLLERLSGEEVLTADVLYMLPQNQHALQFSNMLQDQLGRALQADGYMLRMLIVDMGSHYPSLDIHVEAGPLSE